MGQACVGCCTQILATVSFGFSNELFPTAGNLHHAHYFLERLCSASLRITWAYRSNILLLAE
jgi:hypothetical protein